MKNLLYISNIILFLSFSQGVYAQQSADTIPAELDKTIQVLSSFRPQIGDALRIIVNPISYDTVQLRVSLNYSITSFPIETQFELNPIKAVSVKGDKLQELYKGYVSAGIGNYGNTYASVNYMSERSRKRQYGIGLHHLSTSGKLGFPTDVKYPAIAINDNLSIYNKRFYDSYTFLSGLDYKNKVYNRYGIDTLANLDSLFSESSILRRYYISVTPYVGLQSNAVESKTFKYKTGLQHTFTSQKLKQIENVLLYNFEAEKEIGEIEVAGEFKAAWGHINFMPVDTTFTKDNIEIELKPFVKTKIDNFTIKAGVNANAATDHKIIKAYPEFELDVNLFNQACKPYFVYAGHLKQYSMIQMLEDNPYISNYTMLRPTNYKTQLKVGARGRLLKSFPYDIHLKYEKFEDLFVWVNDNSSSEGLWNSFKPLYDNGESVEFHMEAGLVQKNFTLKGQITVGSTDLQTLEYNYHRPEFQSSLECKYNIVSPISRKNKLVVRGKLLYNDNIWALNTMGMSEKLAPVFDLNLHVDYLYSSRMLLFLHGNNLTATKYQQFYLYPMQRTNVLLGLRYAFGGHKE